jgi:Mg-chelatase subunit ChlI
MATENPNIQDIVGKMAALKAELAKVIVGQQDVIDQIIITLLAGGHALLTGVPGLGKTLLVKTVAQLFSLSFKRIQFTPDLMPADIFGTEVLQEDPATGTRAFKFIRGPVFANIVLADEINRTPPKTQAALLEAMGEYHVTSAGKTIDLERPFFVVWMACPFHEAFCLSQRWLWESIIVMLRAFACKGRNFPRKHQTFRQKVFVGETNWGNKLARMATNYQLMATPMPLR